MGLLYQTFCKFGNEVENSFLIKDLNIKCRITYIYNYKKIQTKR